MSRLASSVRREQILDRAGELAAETGLAHLTMKRIATRVGFSETAIYRYFPTKHALLAGLMDRLEARLLHLIRAIAAEDGTGAIHRLQRIVEHHLGLVLEPHSLSIQLLAEASAAGDPILLSRLRTIMRGYVDVLMGVIEEARAAGSLAPTIDPAVLVIWLLGGPAAMAIQHRLRLDSALEQRVAGRLVPFMFQMIAHAERTR